MSAHHAVIWLDHHEARVFRFTGEDIARVELHAHEHPHRHLHREKGHNTPDAHFFDEAVKALSDAERILVVGPGKAKLELLRHLHTHAHALETKVVGVETVDHPTDNQLVAYARKYFEHSDRMTG